LGTEFGVETRELRVRVVFRVQGSGFRVQGSGFRVQDSGFCLGLGIMGS